MLDPAHGGVIHAQDAVTAAHAETGVGGSGFHPHLAFGRAQRQPCILLAPLQRLRAAAAGQGRQGWKQHQQQPAGAHLRRPGWQPPAAPLRHAAPARTPRSGPVPTAAAHPVAGNTAACAAARTCSSGRG
ncbi:hypothetical protein G6F57_022389 [Rhizopus arrhizus]|nr:hypothetical protein G6F57_022389 [Rhizopus arrhizus]